MRLDLATDTKLDYRMRIPAWKRVMSEAELVYGLTRQGRKVDRR